MFQERIPGGDDHLWTVGSYVDADGRALGVFCGASCCRRRPASAPAGWARRSGTSEAVDGALRLLRELGFHGISQVEYKRDARDGSLRLMEVNARLWQWHSLAADCGVDLVAIAYRDALGTGRPPSRSPAARPATAAGWRWCGTCARAAATGWALRATLAPLRPPFSEPVLSLRDPMPGIHQVYGALRRGGG